MNRAAHRLSACQLNQLAALALPLGTQVGQRTVWAGIRHHNVVSQARDVVVACRGSVLGQPGKLGRATHHRQMALGDGFGPLGWQFCAVYGRANTATAGLRACNNTFNTDCSSGE